MRKGLSRFVHPMVLIEWHQSIRQIWLPVSLLILASLTLRLVMGTAGIFLGIFILIPIVGVSLGIGSFQEEVAKGQLRYLYGMPIRWSTVWWVKQVSAIGTLLVLSAMICAILLIGNDISLGLLEDAVPKAVIVVMLVGLIGVMLLYTLIMYVMSLFTIMACRSAKVAQAIASIMIYLPGLVLVLVCVKFGVIPHVLAVIAMFFSGFLVLAVGSYVLFVMRNPLVARPWRLRGVAAGFVLLACVSFLGAGLIANALGARFQPLPRHLSGFSVGQERGEIALTLSDGLANYTQIIDRDGTVLKEFGEGLSLVGMVDKNWRPGTDQVLCEKSSLWQDIKRGTSQEPWSPDWRLVDPSTGEQAAVVIDLKDENGYQLRPNRWSSDGNRLIGSHTSYGTTAATDAGAAVDESDGPMIYAVIYDLVEGTSERIPMHEPGAQDMYTDSLSEDYFVLSHVVGSGYGGLRGYGMGMGGDEGDDEVDKSVWIERVFLEDNSRVRMTLPTDTESWAINELKEHVIVVVKEIDDQGVGYRVLLYSFAAPDTAPVVLMDGDELPRMTLQEAARDNNNSYLNDVSVSFGGDGQWAVVSVLQEDENELKAAAVIDIQSGDRLEEMVGLVNEYGPPQVSSDHACFVFTKQEGGYLSITDYTNPQQDQMDPETTTLIIYESFGEADEKPVEVAIPGWYTQLDWLDNATIVFSLRQNSGFQLWNAPETTVVRVDVGTGELYRLYPDPGPIEPADLEQKQLPWYYDALITSMNAGP